MKRINALLTVLTLTVSCNKEKISVAPESTPTYSDEEYYAELDPVFIEFGNIIGRFFDEQIKEGTDAFFERNEELKKKLAKPLPLSEVKALYTEIHNMDRGVVEAYFDMLVNHREFILDPNNKKPMMDGIFYYGLRTKKEVQQRWLLTTIANILDAPCEIKVIAGVYDTAVLAAATVITAPTGIGAVVGGISVTSSFIYTVDTALKCD